MDSRGIGAPPQTDALVVGAGAVGMFTALLLAKRGRRVLLVERRTDIPAGSRAIGVSPTSLDALRLVGLDGDFSRAGLGIRRVEVFGRRGKLGSVSFDGIPSDYPYILSLPQADNERILLDAVLREPGIEFREGFSAESLRVDSQGRYCVGFRASAGEPPAEFSSSAPLVCACDGSESVLRQLAGRRFAGHFYRHSFVMGDFVDNSGFGEEARLFFTPEGAVESFPLPGGKRRWITQTPAYSAKPAATTIAELVARRIGLRLDPAEPTWISPFGVRRNRIDRYFQTAGTGFLAFLGDAAHLMSPIGGQGMNTGFADAVQLVEAWESAAVGDPGIGRSESQITQKRITALTEWERRRIRAFNAAANRAWKSMSLGTVRGRLPSAIRDAALWLMLNGPTKNRVPIDYAMLSIPHRTIGLDPLAS